MKGNLNRLKEILKSTHSKEKKAYCLGLVMTYYPKQLTSEDLFSLIPYIWEVENVTKFGMIRGMIEREIKSRQDRSIIEKLIDLLNHEHPYLRFVGADLLNGFNDKIIVEPLSRYITNTKDDLMTKRQAICALMKYDDNRVTQLLEREYNIYKNSPRDFVIGNYLWPIESELKKRGQWKNAT